MGKRRDCDVPDRCILAESNQLIKSCPEMGGHSCNHEHRAVTKWKYTGLD